MLWKILVAKKECIKILRSNAERKLGSYHMSEATYSALSDIPQRRQRQPIASSLLSDTQFWTLIPLSFSLESLSSSNSVQLPAQPSKRLYNMAELLAAGTALSVASSLVTFSDVAWRVLKRLRKYNDRTGDAPAVIKNISVQLPVLIDKMRELETEIGSVSINPQTALAVAVTSCDELIQRLDVVTKKLLREETDSRSKRIKKAFSSVYYEKEVSKAWGEIENYKTLLILHFTKTKGAVQELETPRSKKPIFMVPFERDLKFVGRVGIIADIRQALQRQRRVAIAGIGGVG